VQLDRKESEEKDRHIKYDVLLKGKPYTSTLSLSHSLSHARRLSSLVSTRLQDCKCTALRSQVHGACTDPFICPFLAVKESELAGLKAVSEAERDAGQHRVDAIKRGEEERRCAYKEVLVSFAQRALRRANVR
jgi:hypothetical protein